MTDKDLREALCELLPFLSLPDTSSRFQISCTFIHSFTYTRSRSFTHAHTLTHAPFHTYTCAHTAWVPGHAWTTDYGCADKPDDFATLIKYSPLHNVRSSARQYPAVLVRVAHAHFIPSGTDPHVEVLVGGRGSETSQSSSSSEIWPVNLLENGGGGHQGPALICHRCCLCRS